MGELHKKSIVKLEPTMGIIVLLCNIGWPGFGTIIAGFLNKDAMMNNLIVGLIQMFTCWLLIGWIWSIYTGWLIFNASK